MLAQKRAESASNLMDQLLSNVPREMYQVAGGSPMYVAPRSDKVGHDAQQYVRVTAVYEGAYDASGASALGGYAGGMPAAGAAGFATNVQQGPGAAAYGGGYQAGAPYPNATGNVAPAHQAGARIKNELGMDFVYVPPGSFLMGSPKDEVGRDPNERQWQVTLTQGFYLQSTEVTQAQWEAVMGENPSHFKHHGWNHPVENVSWFDVEEFIKRLNAKENTNAYRLPTESEWEYACRAGSSSAFHYYNGDSPGDSSGYSNVLDRLGWYFRNSQSATHPVGMKEPNAWGIYDMHGNVWEWCADWVGPYPFVHTVDPDGPDSGPARIRRGGSFSHFPMFCRSANRSWFSPYDSAPDLGFRLVKELPAAPSPQPVRAPVVEEKAEPPPAPMEQGVCKVEDLTGETLMVRRGIADASGRQGTVFVERRAPAVVRAGKPFEYSLLVHNLTGCDLEKVIVTEYLASSFRFEGAKPTPDARSGNMLKWEFMPMAAGETREIVITGFAAGAGELKQCADAAFVLNVCTATRVVSPKLELSKRMPSTAVLGEEIPIDLKVVNAGTGVARNVVVTDKLPNGLVGVDGNVEYKFEVGTLEQGQSRDFNMLVRAAETRTYYNTATATGDDGLTAQASSSVKVTAPALQLNKTGPEKQYAGRPVKYELTLTNTGTARAENVMIKDRIPQGMHLIEASHGGAQSGNDVIWQVGSLVAGKSREVNLVLQSHTPGRVVNRAIASADFVEMVTAEATTEIVGIPAMLLEVKDEDPLEVGEKGYYTITVTNQGSLAGRNIQIACEIEPNMEFIAASGPTNAVKVGERKVRFEPLESIVPGASATWRVQVKALSPGDVRFRTELNSAELKRPVVETEATTIY